MTVGFLPVAHRPLAERGFFDACERFEAWVTDGDYDTPTPLADAWNHLYTIRERERRRFGSRRYHAEVNADPNGAVLEGVIFARNLVVHVDADAAIVVGRRPFRMGRSTLGGGDTLGGAGVDVTWRQRGELPPPDDPSKVRGRDLMYDRRVAARSVLDTLNEAYAVLVALSGIP